MKLGTSARVVLSVVSAAIVSAGANGQTPCGGPAGPDLASGPMQGIANYAAAGGVEALALGSTACNLGLAQAVFFASTNQHPVMAQNLFRLSNVGGASRFEQVGMSWLVHGF